MGVSQPENYVEVELPRTTGDAGVEAQQHYHTRPDTEFVAFARHLHRASIRLVHGILHGVPTTLGCGTADADETSSRDPSRQNGRDSPTLVTYIDIFQSA